MKVTAKPEPLLCADEAVHSEAVSKAKNAVLPAGELETMTALFRVLGDPTRMRIIWALDQCELCVCDLSAALAMSKSAISHQLATLREVKLVKFRREGKNIFYSLDDQHVTDLIELALTHVRHQ